MAIALFSYLGVEVASVAAGKVRDPDKNVPRSTVLGTAACAVVYLLSLIAVFGIVPNGELLKSSAPFSTAVNAMFGGTWAGNVMAVVVIISGFGALNGWTMICAEMPLAAAKDGLFPDRFKRLSGSGVPVFGTLATAGVNMLTQTAVFGIVPSSELAKSNAPFSTAVNTMFGGTWVGYVMAVVVIISGFGALNGWTMIVAEMPLAAAKDGLFDDRFKRLSKKGVPAFGIISGTVLASIAMAVNYIGSGGATVFTTLILMTGITVAIPYGFSALAQIKWRIVDNRAVHTPRFVRDMIVAVLSLVFSILFIVY